MAIVFTSEPVAKNTTTKNLDLIKAAECKLQEKSTTISQNGASSVTPDSGYDGLSKVDITVQVPEKTIQANKTVSITTNGQTIVSPDPSNDGMAQVTVDVNVVVPTVQASKAITITQNGPIEILPDSDYDVMEKVEATINVPTSSTYDITQAVVNLAYFTAAEVPANVVGWENLVDATHKCTTSNLTSFEIDLPNVGDATEMFSGCYNLRTFKSNLSSLHSAGYMFTNCTSLTDATINISSYSEQEQEYSGIFAGASILTNLTIEGELRAGLWLHSDLTLESLLSVINALVDLTGEDSKTLNLGANNLAKLSDEQKAIATNKNWILA